MWKLKNSITLKSSIGLQLWKTDDNVAIDRARKNIKKNVKSSAKRKRHVQI
jgi:hypothetical protein